MNQHIFQKSLTTVSENYEKLLNAVVNKIDEFKNENGPVLHKAIDLMTHELIKTEDITLEEAQQLASSLKRDVVDAAHHLTENKDELKSWLDFDIKFIEQNLLNAFLNAADKTTLELQHFQDEAMQSEYKTGEIIGMATLRCDECGELLHFKKAGHIPPCPKCQHTIFHRAHQSK